MTPGPGGAPYTPPPETLDRYADLLVNQALGGGQGIERGDVVAVFASDAAKPLRAAICRHVWRSGAHAIVLYEPASDHEYGVEREFYALASDAQLDYFPERYWKAMIDEADHLLWVRCTPDPRALERVDPAKILRSRAAWAPFVAHRQAKEDAGELSWTLALYGTEGMAAEAGLSIEEYWSQIIGACFLDDAEPGRRWREVDREISRFTSWLNAMPIDRLRVEGPDCDLRLTLGERRRWIGGGGTNVPSFEVYTSPNWRGTEGWIRFSEPLYCHGSVVKGVELEFTDGVVTRLHASENASVIREMVAIEGADRVGEFSLTDARLSRITRFMADTLYDENVGGPLGNTHIAIGESFHECYDGDPAELADDAWARLGFNESAIHTDIVSTTDRTVTATLCDGSERVVYADGRFTLDGE